MKKYLLMLFLCYPVSLYSQMQDNIWYFGGLYWDQQQAGAGLDFTLGIPTPLTNSAMGYTEGCASYCNSAGELLFYGSGELIYDRTHNVMQNGDSLGGHWSTMQSILIVPVTGDTNKYFVFTNDGMPTSNGTGLYYSIIDMTLNGGFGAVTTKSVHLLSNTREQLTGTKHGNGVDFWVITTSFSDCKYYAYRVTATGVQPPIISDLGYSMDCLGHLIIRKDGLKIVNVPFETQKLTLYNFDINTGIVSSPLEFNSFHNGGLSFSPDGNLFYQVVHPDTLVQYDLTATDIQGSRTPVGILGLGLKTSMRIGPDGKIYLSTYSTSVDIIHNPNVLGMGCNYQSNALYLNGRHSGFNFPNIVLVADAFVGISEQHLDLLQTAVYPNPFNDYTTIEFSNLTSGNYTLYFYDIHGRTVKIIENITSNIIVLKRENLSSGNYIFKLLNKDILFASGELIIY